MTLPRPSSAILLGVVILLFTPACEQAPQQVAQTEPEPPPEPVEGQKAFYPMYVAARSWAPDAQGLRLECVNIPEVAANGARCGAWRATFVSPAKRRTVVFNYSVVESSGKLRKGVFRDHEEGYSEGRAKPWPPVALKITSVKALEVAMERKETKEYVKKNPEVPIFFVLEQTNRHSSLAWRVVWGESISRSAFSVFVDASTGNYLEIMR
ncbi:MAG: hypothetical protein GY953_01485 [bacterium]|nr:hypothetical protein [bacterium]